MEHVDPYGAEVIGRADARPLQERRGCECAGRQNDPSPAQYAGLASGDNLDASSATALEKDPAHLLTGEDRKVRAAANGRIKIGHRGGYALIASIG